MSRDLAWTETSQNEAGWARIAGLLLIASSLYIPRTFAETVKIKLTAAGFEPRQIHVAAGAKVELVVTRVTDATCAREIIFPDLNVRKDLPLNTPVPLDLGVVKKGRHPFGCAMGLMIDGEVLAGVPVAKEPSKKKASRPFSPPRDPAAGRL